MIEPNNILHHIWSHQNRTGGRKMGKRPDFERHPRGLYPTPKNAVRPLLLYLPSAVRLDEPCAGDGALVRHLQARGHSLGFTSDIQPMAVGIMTSGACSIERCTGQIFITNPPWPELNRFGDPTLSILMHLSSLGPTRLLLPADFSHNVNFHKVIDCCRKIVSVDRVKWIPGGKDTGKNNAAWHLFDEIHGGHTHYHGRESSLRHPFLTEKFCPDDPGNEFEIYMDFGHHAPANQFGQSIRCPSWCLVAE